MMADGTGGARGGERRVPGLSRAHGLAGLAMVSRPVACVRLCDMSGASGASEVSDAAAVPNPAAFATLLGACREITPRVEAHPAAGVAVLDLAGCEGVLVPRGAAVRGAGARPGATTHGGRARATGAGAHPAGAHPAGAHPAGAHPCAPTHGRGGRGIEAGAQPYALTRGGDVGADWPALARALVGRARAACPGERIAVGLAPDRVAAWLAASQVAASWHARPWCAAGVADGVEAPRALALAPDEVAPFLDPLPLGALLDLPEIASARGGALDARAARGALDALEALARGGVRTLGQLARIPEVALRRRFGEALGTALARIASGRDALPVRAETREVWTGVWLPLEPPLELRVGGDGSSAALDAFDGVLARLAERLAVVLCQRGLEAGTVAVCLRAEGGTRGGARGGTRGAPCGRRAYWGAMRRLGRPTASAEALRDHGRRLVERLVGIEDRRATAGRYASGRAVSVHLRVGGLRPAVPRQATCWPVGRSGDRHAARERLLAAAAGRGACVLLRAELVAPHAVLPEERYVLRAA